eukprot:scaffold17194_cov20-Tisochrysis_lutea.AAC.3
MLLLVFYPDASYICVFACFVLLILQAKLDEMMKGPMMKGPTAHVHVPTGSPHLELQELVPEHEQELVELNLPRLID